MRPGRGYGTGWTTGCGRGCSTGSPRSAGAGSRTTTGSGSSAVAAAFCRVAACDPWHQADDRAHAVAWTEDWYAGDGWYTGRRHAELRPLQRLGDAPVPVVVLPHPVARWLATGLAERYRLRLRRYLSGRGAFVGGDGALAVPGPLADLPVLRRSHRSGPARSSTPPRCRPGAPGGSPAWMLRYFLSAGCLRADGTLSIGWHGEFLPVRQMYSGPGSPYWAAKGGSLGLLLQAGDLGHGGPARNRCRSRRRGDFTLVARAPRWLRFSWHNRRRHHPGRQPRHRITRPASQARRTTRSTAGGHGPQGPASTSAGPTSARRCGLRCPR